MPPPPISRYNDNNYEEEISPSERPQSTPDDVVNNFNGGINPTFNVGPNTAEPSTPTKTPNESGNNTYVPCIADKYLHVEQRAKVFRSHDKVLWALLVSDVGEAGSSTNTSKSSKIKGSIFDEDFTLTISDKYGKNSKEVIRPTGLDDVLLITKTLNEHLTVHEGEPRNSVISKSVFWACYFDPNIGKFVPITGVFYFDLYYDSDTHVIDLIFWSNVYRNYLDDSSYNADLLYDGRKGPQDADSFDELRPNGPIQRCLFYTKGTYREVTIGNKSESALDTLAKGVFKLGASEEEGAAIVGMFIFTRPVLLMNPGQFNTDETFGDPIVDKVKLASNTFVELK